MAADFIACDGRHGDELPAAIAGAGEFVIAVVTYRDLPRKLRALGGEFDRPSRGSHEIG